MNIKFMIKFNIHIKFTFFDDTYKVVVSKEQNQKT